MMGLLASYSVEDATALPNIFIRKLLVIETVPKIWERFHEKKAEPTKLCEFNYNIFGY